MNMNPQEVETSTLVTREERREVINSTALSPLQIDNSQIETATSKPITNPSKFFTTTESTITYKQQTVSKLGIDVLYAK